MILLWASLIAVLAGPHAARGPRVGQPCAREFTFQSNEKPRSLGTPNIKLFQLLFEKTFEINF